MLQPAINRIRGISLKWKLLIPFLFFAFSGTMILTYIGLTSQQRLIMDEERKEILHHYQQFLESTHQKTLQALTLATMVSEIPEVQKDLAARDRQGLIDLLLYTYVRLKMDFDIEQFHFHVPPATSFLRLHYLERFGEDMGAYRKTISDAIESGRPTAGLEWGETGFGLRGVVPVHRYGKVVGSVEIGYSFGKALLDDFQKRWGFDLILYEVRDHELPRLLAKSGKWAGSFDAAPYLGSVTKYGPSILTSPKGFPGRSIILGPVKDYGGDTVAIVEIAMDRSEIRRRLSRTRNLMVTVGFLGIAVSFILIYLVTRQFIRPIKEIVTHAQDIADEKRESRLKPRPGDEIGVLTQALNVMLDALKQRRKEIEQHASVLERRVRERTADLVESEDKYRTLVENVPLIVYRVLQDGTTEFINSYLTESLGYNIEEAVGNKSFWQEKICQTDDGQFRNICTSCFNTGEECRVERTVRGKDGRVRTFLDHAIPGRDAHGRIRWVDGIMMDITELKRLQERALLSEEIRLLGEISAHMAHEIRNPLITAGGFARRLLGSLPERDPNRKLVHIIVEEVARLENYMKLLVSSIRPFDLSLTDLDIVSLLEAHIRDLEELIKSRGMQIVCHFPAGNPRIRGDRERLPQALENLLKHAVVSTPEGEKIYLSIVHEAEDLVVTMRHKVLRLSDDDLEKFFFPHTGKKMEWDVLDLPFSKIVIHRHGGKVKLDREGENVLVMRIELPVKPVSDGRVQAFMPPSAPRDGIPL